MDRSGFPLNAPLGQTPVTSVATYGTAALLNSDTDTTLAANSDSNVATQKAVKAYVSASSGPVGSARNSRMSVSSASASATFTADEIVVETALGGSVLRIASYSQAINLGTTGAGGMDTGAAPASGFVSIYAIAKADGTKNILACNVSTSNGSVYSGANMPSGYTYSALIGVWPTDGSSRFIVGIIQDRSFYRPAVAILTTSSPATTLTSLSASSLVPTNARYIVVSGYNTVSAHTLTIASDSSGTGAIYINYANSGSLVFGGAIPLITSQTVYYSASSGTDSIGVWMTGYLF